MSHTIKMCAASILAFATSTALTAAGKSAHALALLANPSMEAWKILVLAQFGAYLVLIAGCAALLAALAAPALRGRATPFVWMGLLVLTGFVAEDAWGVIQGAAGAAKDTHELAIRLLVLTAMLTAWHAPARRTSAS